MQEALKEREQADEDVFLVGDEDESTKDHRGTGYA